jgi:hypothetical protein
MLLSIAFYGLHCHYMPFKSTACNRLQTLCLSVLTIIYFLGVLLKTESVEQSDRENLGVLMVLLMVSIFLAFIGFVYMEVRAMRTWMKEVEYAAAKVSETPMYNPDLHDHIIAVDDIKLGKMLGQGAEGMVRKASYQGMEVAVKIQSVSEYSAIPIMELLQEAQAEAQVLLPLRHPNIVGLFGICIDTCSCSIEVMIVLELCACSLNDTLFNPKVSSLSWLEKVQLCQHMAQGEWAPSAVISPDPHIH